MSAVLEFVGAEIAYPDRSVLEEISLAVEPGEILAVVGPNGVGKSSLVKAASGVLPVAKGQALVGGQNVLAMSPSERARWIGVVPQAVQVPPAFTARQVVLMGRTPYLGWLDREGEEDQRLADRAMGRTFTSELAERRMGELSGGEQQRVLVARSLAQAPKALLLDEPTAHLDLRHQDEVLRLVHTVAREENMAVLIALHDLNLVARFADRVALLSNGRVMVEGPPREVLTPDKLARAYGVEIHVMDHPVHGTPLVLSS